MKNQYVINPIVLASMETVKKIAPHPVVIQINDVKEEKSKSFGEQMSDAHQSPQPVIPVVVNSFGGSCYALLSIVSEIQNATKPVATIATGKAMSAGLDILAMGTHGYRFAAPNSMFLMHEVTYWGEGKVEEVKASAKLIDYLNNKIFKMLAKHCGHRDGYFLDIIHQKKHANWYFNENEAKKHNLIDHIGVPENLIDINVSYKFKFGNKVLASS